MSETRRDYGTPILIRPFGEADGAGLGSEGSFITMVRFCVAVDHAVWYRAVWYSAVLDVLMKPTQIHTMRNSAPAVLVRADGGMNKETNSVLSCPQSPIQFVRGCRRQSRRVRVSRRRAVERLGCRRLRLTCCRVQQLTIMRP